MYTPDGVEVKLEKVSKTAARVYLYYCKWRDHTTGYSRKGFEHARADLKLTRATAYRAHRELIDHDFISETSGGCVGLRGGSFKPVDKTAAATLVWSKPRPERHENGSLIFETEGGSSLKNETENLNLETNSLKFETEHIEERARGFSSTSSSNTQQHTHTPQPAREAPPDGGGVCVSMPRHSKEILRRYAAAHSDRRGEPLGEGWVTEAFRSGEWDDAVGLWLEGQKPEAVARSLAAPAQAQMSFRAALLYVGSILDVNPQLDIPGAVAQLSLSEETRAALLAYDFGRRRAQAAPEVRAHAPP